MSKIKNITAFVDDARYPISVDEDAVFSLVQECVNSLARAKPGKVPEKMTLTTSCDEHGIDVKIKGDITTSEGKIFNWYV